MSPAPCCSQRHPCHLAFRCSDIFSDVIKLFVTVQMLIVKNVCLPVPPHPTSFIPAVTLRSHEHAPRLTGRETEAQRGPVLLTVTPVCLQSCGLSMPSLDKVQGPYNSPQCVPSLEGVHLASVLLSQLELLRLGMSDGSRSIEAEGAEM